ncbi:MAG: prenyltransferase/squalene oxidase repeat-containing protein [Myxococcales bacterium]
MVVRHELSQPTRRLKFPIGVLTALVLCSGMLPCTAEPDPPSPAVAAGLAYLRSQLARGGLGLGCESTGTVPCPLGGTGSPLVAFFVVSALGGRMTADEAERISSTLLAEERNGLWGYAPTAPLDADDSAFALATLRAVKRPGNEPPHSLAPLLRFYHSDVRAFGTFVGDPGTRLAGPTSMEENRQLHAEVNANVAAVYEGSALSAYAPTAWLVTTQAADGSFPSYFYPSRYYGTWAALRGLCAMRSGDAAIERAIAFVEGSQGADGGFGASPNAYDTALAVLALASCGKRGNATERGCAYLRRTQEASGAWPAPRYVWEYRYADGPAGSWRATDDAQVLTTALAVFALGTEELR